MMLRHGCERCGEVYTPIHALGMHECRMHTGTMSWMSIYNCCNMEQNYDNMYNTGCVPVDHMNSNVPIQIRTDVSDYIVLLEQSGTNIEDFAKRPGVYRHSDGKWYVSTIAKHN